MKNKWPNWLSFENEAHSVLNFFCNPKSWSRLDPTLRFTPAPTYRFWRCALALRFERSKSVHLPSSISNDEHLKHESHAWLEYISPITNSLWKLLAKLFGCVSNFFGFEMAKKDDPKTSVNTNSLSLLCEVCIIIITFT